ncbi:class B sortase, partial [Alistipes onderdonkii]|nr:class B sortase [Alistipes onderdonkii]
GDYAIEGAIYTEMANNTDFSDPVTVLYGHNLQNGTMFSTLHYFENEDFFNEQDPLYIYTPGHALTYRVVSAYLYDDRHILNSY